MGKKWTRAHLKSYLQNVFRNYILIYMYKKDLALNNPQWLRCHKTQTKPNPIYLIYMYKEDLALNNLQLSICHETQPNQIYIFSIYV